jgi:hypothetical protein
VWRWVEKPVMSKRHPATKFRISEGDLRCSWFLPRREFENKKYQLILSHTEILECILRLLKNY